MGLPDSPNVHYKLPTSVESSSASSRSRASYILTERLLNTNLVAEEIDSNPSARGVYVPDVPIYPRRTTTDQEVEIKYWLHHHETMRDILDTVISAYPLLLRRFDGESMLKIGESQV